MYIQSTNEENEMEQLIYNITHIGADFGQGLFYAVACISVATVINTIIKKV